MEALRSGKFDKRYNEVGRDYEADQGISSRSSCPIYLAVKTEVLAIKAALRDQVEDDFYVSDLSQIFKYSALYWSQLRRERLAKPS